MPSSIDIDIAFVIDVTGSMAPFAHSAGTSITSVLEGPDSIREKLQSQFPDIEFRLRMSLMGYRDIDDGAHRFLESTWQVGKHFTDNNQAFKKEITSVLGNPSGGSDIAEDHLGAINRCSMWNAQDDWTSQIKFMIMLTDAPAHGMVPKAAANFPNADNYATRHPEGLTPESVLGNLINRGIDLFFCSFNPAATKETEMIMAEQYLNHPDNKEGLEITTIKMIGESSTASTDVVPSGSVSACGITAEYGKHIIFVLRVIFNGK